MKVFLKRILPGLDGSFDIDRGVLPIHVEIAHTSFHEETTVRAIWVVDASTSEGTG